MTRPIGRPPLAEKNAQSHTYLPQKDIDKLDAMAKKMRISRSGVFAMIIGKYLDEAFEEAK